MNGAQRVVFRTEPAPRFDNLGLREEDVELRSELVVSTSHSALSFHKMSCSKVDLPLCLRSFFNTLMAKQGLLMFMERDELLEIEALVNSLVLDPQFKLDLVVEGRWLARDPAAPWFQTVGFFPTKGARVGVRNTTLSSAPFCGSPTGPGPDIDLLDLIPRS